MAASKRNASVTQYIFQNKYFSEHLSKRNTWYADTEELFILRTFLNYFLNFKKNVSFEINLHAFYTIFHIEVVPVN